MEESLRWGSLGQRPSSSWKTVLSVPPLPHLWCPSRHRASMSVEQGSNSYRGICLSVLRASAQASHPHTPGIHTHTRSVYSRVHVYLFVPHTRTNIPSLTPTHLHTHTDTSKRASIHVNMPMLIHANRCTYCQAHGLPTQC